MTESKVDLLATLRRMREAKHSFQEADAAIASVAELIEADKAYDTARIRSAHAFKHGSRGDFQEQLDASEMLVDAKKRRSAALAACTPAKSEGR